LNSNLLFDKFFKQWQYQKLYFCRLDCSVKNRAQKAGHACTDFRAY